MNLMSQLRYLVFLSLLNSCSAVVDPTSTDSHNTDASNSSGEADGGLFLDAAESPPIADASVSTEDAGMQQDASTDYCSLLTPTFVDSVDLTLFPRVEHPKKPDRVEYTRRPTPTNHFMLNLLFEESRNFVFVQPYAVALLGDPSGLSVSHPSSFFSGGEGLDNAFEFYGYNHTNDLSLSAVESVSQTRINDFDEFSVNIKQFFANDGTLEFPIVRGMAYVTAEYSQVTPQLHSAHRITRINGREITQNSRVSGSRFQLELSNGTTWIVYSLGGTVDFSVAERSLTAQIAGSYVLRVAKAPSSSSSALKILDEHHKTYPIGGDLTAALGRQSEDAASYSFTWQTKGRFPPKLLHYAFPHHIEILKDQETVSEITLRSTTKGLMQGVLGIRWTLIEPELTSIRWLPPRSVKQAHKADVENQLERDIRESFDVPSGSFYFAGKSLYKRAILCLMAQELGRDDLGLMCLSKLKTAMSPFVLNNAFTKVKYDQAWGGVISSAGLGADPYNDFGNSYYNDHHYHWGYYVTTAAIIAHLDPSWISANRTWVETLIRDVSNTDASSQFFPYFRSFDWFSGHSWSQGIFLSQDGKDQESTSEEVNFHYGMMLWGLATDNLRLYNLGRLMLAVASRSINTYFLMRDDNTVHPPGFIGNKVTGIFFQNKCHYTTWFGRNREFIHGIQMLPVTPMTEEVRYSDFVAEEWEHIGGLIPNLNSGWKSVLLTNFAIINADSAFEQLKTAPLDDGLLRSWAMYWASSRPVPGSVTRPAMMSEKNEFEDYLSSDCR